MVGFLAPIRRIGEAVRSRIVGPIRDQLAAERATSAHLAESVANLERALFDPGWVRLTALAEQEFSVDGLRQLRAICRLYAIKNPLINRGLGLRSAYVHGQGVEITARAQGKRRGEQDVQAVINSFLDDPGNQQALTSTEAVDQLEHALGTEGELFISCWTRPLTGAVRVRTISPDEITEIICNPDDAAEPWYYRRQWTETVYNPDGQRVTRTRELLYPALDYRPRTRPRRLGEVQIRWDAPVLHVAVNRPRGWQRGIPDAYAAIDWARAYKTFLEDWATLIKSLSRFAWRFTTKGSGRKQAQQRLAARPPVDPTTGHAQDVGATAITPLDAVLEAIPKSGATIDSESGRPLASMVAAALGLPVTMLLGDPGTTGARATAETLDQPTELTMQLRRGVWESALRRVLAYVIASAVRAPQGPLKGRVIRDPVWDRETIQLDGGTSAELDFTWPDLDDIDQATVVKSIVEANRVGVVPPQELLRLLLTALGVRHVDEIIDEMTGPDGEFLWPPTPLSPGVQALALARAGGDPAQAGVGPMGGDDPTEEPAGDGEG